jgi:hypothetical protein
MHSDYIMRMVLQYIKALLAVMKSRKAEQYDEAYVQILQTSELYLGDNIDRLVVLSPNELLNYFKTADDLFDSQRSVMCADLFYELAIICKAKGAVEAAVKIEKSALYLYTKAIPKETQFQDEERFSKIAELIENLKQQDLSVELKASIAEYNKFKEVLKK